MKNFFKKAKQLERKRVRKLAMLSGGVALVAMLTVFVSAGIPSKVYAWVITIYPITYTPVTPGGYTTISWHAPTSDVCSLRGPTLPCTNFGGLTGGTICQQSVNGPDGSITTGPINSPTTYTILCQNVDSGGGGGAGSNTITVVPVAADNCPNIPTAVTSGLQLPPGNNYHIVAQGFNFCVNNGSGKYLYLQTTAYAAVASFYNATQGYLSGSVAYYGRTSGY